MTIISDHEELLKLKKEMEDEIYHDLFEEFEIDDKFYSLDFRDELNLPEKFRSDAVILPTTREVVGAAVNHVNPVFRRITVPRRSANPKATQQAQKLKKYYSALLNWFEKQPSTSPFRDANIFLNVYGKAEFKILWDAAKRPDKPKREQFDDDEEYEEALADWEMANAENMPYTLLVPHPSTVMPDPWNDPPQWAIEHNDMRVGQVKALYPNWANESGKKLSDMVEVIEYWDKDARSVIADKQPALKTRDGSGLVRHKWRIHPYICGASGLGYDDKDRNPEKRYVGLIRYIRGVITSESRAYSISDIVMKSEAWPVRTIEGERANDAPVIKMDDYGTLQPLPPGVTINSLKPELPAERLAEHQAITNGIISSATAPRVVRGLSQTGMRSGFDRQLAMGEARLQYDPIARAMERMLTELCFKAGVLMENLGKGRLSIAAGAEEDEFTDISPSDFKGHHAVNVEVNVLEPEDEIRRNTDAANMVSNGLWSPQTAIRKRFPDLDPKTELGRSVSWRVLNSEPIMNMLGMAAAQTVGENLGLEQIVDAVLQQVQQAQQETPGRGRDVGQPREQQAEQGNGSRSEQAQMRQMDGR